MPCKPNRNAQGARTIRQRPDGRWEARYTAGCDSGTGRQVQKFVYGETQAEVRKKLNEITNSIDNGTYTAPAKMKLSAWLDIWLAEYLGSVKPETVKSYRDTINLHIKPDIGAASIQSLNAYDIQKFYNGMQKKKNRTGQNLSAKTVRNAHGVLHSALKQAALLGYMRNNPTENCILPRIEKNEMNFLSDKQIGKFIQAMKGDIFETLFFVTLFTGMRKGEVCGLTWDCIAFNKDVILINKQLQVNRFTREYGLTSPKNDKPRKLMPPKSVIDKLRIVKTNQLEARLAAGSSWRNDWNLVFTTSLGEHISFITVSKHCRSIMKSIGAEDVRFHDLRHSYAVSALQSGVDIKTISETLGHVTVAFTLEFTVMSVRKSIGKTQIKWNGLFITLAHYKKL